MVISDLAQQHHQQTDALVHLIDRQQTDEAHHAAELSTTLRQLEYALRALVEAVI